MVSLSLPPRCTSSRCDTAPSGRRWQVHVRGGGRKECPPRGQPMLLLLFPGNARCEVAVELAEPLRAALPVSVVSGLGNMEDVASQSGGGGGGIVVIHRSSKRKEPNSSAKQTGSSTQREHREFIHSCTRRLLHARRVRFLRDRVLPPCMLRVASKVMACVSTLLPPSP